MKKLKRLIFISLSFSALTCGAFEVAVAKIKPSVKSYFHIRSNLGLLKKNLLLEELRSFVKASRPARMVGTAGHLKAEEYLLKRIREIDPNEENLLYVDRFSPDVDYAASLYQADFKREIEAHYEKDNPVYKKWDTFTKQTVKALQKRRDIKGANIIWEKTGKTKPNDLLIIGAHYDTIAHNPETHVLDEESAQPGADDNGSGVVIALAAIQMLSKMDIPQTVRVVFFDWEELGFLGSHAFVAKYKPEFKDKNFLGYINLEMLGHDSKITDKKKKYGNMKAYIRKQGKDGHEADKAFAEKLIKAGDKISPSVEFELVANDFNNSDNINFWKAGFPAVTFSENWEDDFNKSRYHTADDFVETININTFYRSYEFIVGSIMAYIYDIAR